MVKKSDETGTVDKPKTVAFMVREALDELGWKAKPDAYRKYIMDKYGKDVPKNQISQYKSAEKRKLGGTKKRSKPAMSSNTEAAPGDQDLDTIFAFINALRPWEELMGIAKMKDIMSKIYKKA